MCCYQEGHHSCEAAAGGYSVLLVLSSYPKDCYGSKVRQVLCRSFEWPVEPTVYSVTTDTISVPTSRTTYTVDGGPKTCSPPPQSVAIRGIASSPKSNCFSGYKARAEISSACSWLSIQPAATAVDTVHAQTTVSYVASETVTTYSAVSTPASFKIISQNGPQAGMYAYNDKYSPGSSAVRFNADYLGADTYSLDGTVLTALSGPASGRLGSTESGLPEHFYFYSANGEALSRADRLFCDVVLRDDQETCKIECMTASSSTLGNRIFGDYWTFARSSVVLPLKLSLRRLIFRNEDWDRRLDFV